MEEKTYLIINTLTEEQARKLKSFFGDKPRIVKGTETGSYGVLIPFKDWIKSKNYNIQGFLWSDKVYELIGLQPTELRYLEAWIEEKRVEEIDYSELFPVGGFWIFGSLKYNPERGTVYYHGMRIAKSSLKEAKDIREEVSKLYRRGIIDDSEV